MKIFVYPPGNVPGKKAVNQPIVFISDHASFTGSFLVPYVDLVFQSLAVKIVDLLC